MGGSSETVLSPTRASEGLDFPQRRSESLREGFQMAGCAGAPSSDALFSDFLRRHRLHYRHQRVRQGVAASFAAPCGHGGRKVGW